MTIGALTVFLAYLNKFFKPVQDLAKMTNSIAQAAVALERISGILDTDNIIADRDDVLQQKTGPHARPLFRPRYAKKRFAQILLQDTPVESQRPWYTAAGSLLVVAFDEVKRLLAGVGEVITAWFSPAGPGEAIAAAPPAAPQFLPARHDANPR